MADVTLENALRAMEVAYNKGDMDAAKEMAALAKSLEGQSQKPSGVQNFMGHVNSGIAGGVGGLVDFINPLDNFGITGSAEQGLRSGMQAIGASVAEEAPANAVEGFAHGIGEAASLAAPAARAFQFAGRAPGAVGQFFDDAAASMATKGGVAIEAIAGGVSGAAREGVEQAGGPKWLQDTAGILAPLSLAGGASAARYAPSVVGIRAAQSRLAAMLAPYTQKGGAEIASNRLQGLAGGPGRAEELAGTISANEFGLTPAQQTGDPNMLAVEKLAAAQDPALRARLDERSVEAQAAGRTAIEEMGGDPNDARAFFEERRSAFTSRAATMVERAVQSAEAKLSNLAPDSDELTNSLEVSRSVRNALDDALAEEAALWGAIPTETAVGTGFAKEAAQSAISGTPRAQQQDVATVVRELLGGDGGFADVEPVKEMHGLYSELRRMARSAMAGNDQNKNRARIANEIADAILKDLGAVDGATSVGRRINEARAYSAALHETFDRGAVGKLLTKTLDGDTRIEPELALDRTVGQMGIAGAVASRQLETANPNTRAPVVDFLKGRFEIAAVSATGEFTRTSARTFIRDNDPLLARYPELKAEIDNAVTAKEGAQAFAERVATRIAKLEDARQSAGAAFLNGSPQKVVQGILTSAKPVQAAKSLAREARKDGSGAALAGVKGAFVDHLMKSATGVSGGSQTLSGDSVLKAVTDPKTKSVLRQIFNAEELNRLRFIGSQMAKLNASSGGTEAIGATLSGAKPNRVVETLLRVVAARHGAQLGGGSGGSLQTAQMASSRVKEALGRLTSDKASQIIAEAVENPELYKALLTRTNSPALEARVLPRLVPYLVGAVSTAGGE